MARNTSITLGDHFEALVDRLVSAGRYGSVSEVVRAGLRLLEEHEARTEALRQALITGAASGDAGPLDLEAVRRAGHARLGSRAGDA